MATGALKIRYGIGEWFGQDVAELNRAQRAANLALAQNKSTLEAACPFAAALNLHATCSKPGGVCTIRKYEQHGKGAVAVSDQPVTVCPQRFLQDAKLLQWAGQVMLGTGHPNVMDGIRFLTSKSNSHLLRVGLDDDLNSWAVVNPDADAKANWCWLITQSARCDRLTSAAEFMDSKFANGNAIPLPEKNRRPNFGRSALFRISAHLNRTTPIAREFGAKTAVLVDEFFFAKVAHVWPLEGNSEQQLSDADVVWLVARHQDGRLVPGKVIYSFFNDSIRALLAPPSPSRKIVENFIRSLIADPEEIGRRVFKL